MKIAISSEGKDKDAQVDKRFGRCSYFIIADTEADEFESIDNEHTSESHGVGPQVVQMLSDKDVDAVITGNIGPNAYQTLESAEIKAYKSTGKVNEAVEKLEKGELEEITDETVDGHFGKQGGRKR